MSAVSPPSATAPSTALYPTGWHEAFVKRVDQEIALMVSKLKWYHFSDPISPFVAGIKAELTLKFQKCDEVFAKIQNDNLPDLQKGNGFSTLVAIVSKWERFLVNESHNANQIEQSIDAVAAKKSLNEIRERMLQFVFDFLEHTRAQLWTIEKQIVSNDKVEIENAGWLERRALNSQMEAIIKRLHDSAVKGAVTPAKRQVPTESDRTAVDFRTIFGSDFISLVDALEKGETINPEELLNIIYQIYEHLKKKNNKDLSDSYRELLRQVIPLAFIPTHRMAGLYQRIREICLHDKVFLPDLFRELFAGGIRPTTDSIFSFPGEVMRTFIYFGASEATYTPPLVPPDMDVYNTAVEVRKVAVAELAVFAPPVALQLKALKEAVKKEGEAPPVAEKLNALEDGMGKKEDEAPPLFPTVLAGLISEFFPTTFENMDSETRRDLNKQCHLVAAREASSSSAAAAAAATAPALSSPKKGLLKRKRADEPDA